MSFTNRYWLLAAIYLSELESQVMDRIGGDNYHAIGDQHGYPQADAVAALADAVGANYPNVSDDLDDDIFDILDVYPNMSVDQKWNLIAEKLAILGVPTTFLGLDSGFLGNVQEVAAAINNGVTRYFPLLS